MTAAVWRRALLRFAGFSTCGLLGSISSQYTEPTASRRRRWRVTTLIRRSLDQRHASAGRRRGGGPSGRRLSAAREIGRALAALAAAGKARMVPRPETGGRPAEIWVATGA